MREARGSSGALSHDVRERVIATGSRACLQDVAGLGAADKDGAGQDVYAVAHAALAAVRHTLALLLVGAVVGWWQGGRFHGGGRLREGCRRAARGSSGACPPPPTLTTHPHTHAAPRTPGPTYRWTPRPGHP